jgi:hypothetical protein
VAPGRFPCPVKPRFLPGYRQECPALKLFRLCDADHVRPLHHPLVLFAEIKHRQAREREDGMIERLMTKAAEQVDHPATQQPRLSMAWYLDPMTGKPTARWVTEVADGAAARKLPKAA